MKYLIKYLELKVSECKKECKSLEVVEAEKAIKEALEAQALIGQLKSEIEELTGDRY